jgi:hypothetical protein
MQKEDFESYFKEELDDLKLEKQKAEQLFSLVQESVNKLTNSETKGALHYLIESCKNLISVQAQKQNVIKDIVNIKKIVLDYSLKSDQGSSDTAEVLNALNAELKAIREKTSKKQDTGDKLLEAFSDIDSEIDRILEEENQ